MKNVFSSLIALCSFTLLQAQMDYWQQEVHYDMHIDFDVEKHQFTGKQHIRYVNNSPDTLDRLFFHLYFNAFEPGSMMDQRSQDLPDPDSRISKRIGKLNKEEIGYHKIDKLVVDGTSPAYEIYGTLMHINLEKPIAPNDTSEITLDFHSQVPQQVRRSGRMNSEGVDYTMTQWYPKLAEYSPRGWHTQQYVNREFFGVFGDFDVRITIDKDYVLGGTGRVINACELDKRVAEAYCPDEIKRQRGDKQTWHFRAEDVHDFAWAADPDFILTHRQSANDVDLFFLRLPDTDEESWNTLSDYTQRFMEEMSAEFGQYPYPQFSVIQGGDGGMEYPMCTMILGRGGKDNLPGMIGLMVHEAAHNWYYGVLGFDEQRYSWMDEGFTTYAENVIMHRLFHVETHNAHSSAFRSYRNIKEKGQEEPLTTPADHFCRNRTYGSSAYSMGSLYLAQLEYIVGKEVLRSSLRQFFEEWKFRHPEPRHLLQILQKNSGMQLFWFHDLWIGTTQHIDYNLLEVSGEGKMRSSFLIRREGAFPMPLEIRVTMKDSTERWVYVPTNKTVIPKEGNFLYAETWPWTQREREVSIDIPIGEIAKVEIDPHGRMADLHPENNTWPTPIEKEKG